MRILCTGDLHIGRRSSRIPNANSTTSCSSAWKRIVTYAIKNKIELILVSGDFIDRDNKNFEAMGPIRAGIEELEKHNIHVICVAGNHDHDVLPEIVQKINRDNFFLLGRGGCWEEHHFNGSDATTLVINGWSFPKPSYRISPLNSISINKNASSFNIGLMHADYEVSNSSYGPVSHVELEASGVDLWVLGHIHRRAIIDMSSGRKAIYPGSPQAMDPGPGEQGEHGFYDVEIKNDKILDIDFIPVSSVRYEELTVDISDCDNEFDVESKVSYGISDAVNQYICESDKYDKVLSFLSISLFLTGRQRFEGGIHNSIQKIIDADLDTFDLQISIHKVIDNTLYNYSAEQISQIANGIGASAAVAKLIQEIENSPDKVIPERFRSSVNSSRLELSRAKLYRESGVMLNAWDDAEIKDILIKQSYALLDSILANQKMNSIDQ